MHPRLNHTHATCLHLELFLFSSVSQWWKYCWPLLKAEMFCGKGRQCWPVMRLLHICFADPNTEDLERSWAISPAALSTWQRQRRLEVNASWQAPTSCSVVAEKITLPFLKKSRGKTFYFEDRKSDCRWEHRGLSRIAFDHVFFLLTNHVFWRKNLMTEWVEWA